MLRSHMILAVWTKQAGIRGVGHMKYRILLLLALMCAVLVAAISGTLAGYTDETVFSFSIQPDTSSMKPNAQPRVEVSAETPYAQTEDTTQSAADTAQSYAQSEPTTDEIQAELPADNDSW